MKEALPPTSSDHKPQYLRLFEEFAATSKKAEAGLNAEREHEQGSLLLFDTCAKLLKAYGVIKFETCPLGEEELMYDRFGGARSYLETPKVLMDVKGKKIPLRIRENLMPASLHLRMTKTDKVPTKYSIDILEGRFWQDFLKISEAHQQTRNWLDEKASPEQMKDAVKLLSDIESLLQEKCGKRATKKEK